MSDGDIQWPSHSFRLQPHILNGLPLYQRSPLSKNALLFGYGDFQHLSEPHWRGTEPQIGDVKVAIRTECHSRRQRESGCNLYVLILAINPQNLSGSWRRVWIPGCILKHVQAAFRVESESKNVAKTDINGRDMPTRGDLQDFRRPILDRKSIEVSDEKIMSVKCQSCGHDVALEIRNISDSSNLSPYRDGIEFSVIRFDCIEDSVNSNHAVPRAVWFEVVRFWIRNRMALLESR